jgi:hypothetical protein
LCISQCSLNEMLCLGGQMASDVVRCLFGATRPRTNSCRTFATPRPSHSFCHNSTTLQWVLMGAAAMERLHAWLSFLLLKISKMYCDHCAIYHCFDLTRRPPMRSSSAHRHGSSAILHCMLRILFCMLDLIACNTRGLLRCGFEGLSIAFNFS